jgi:hypothetical protein
MTTSFSTTQWSSTRRTRPDASSVGALVAHAAGSRCRNRQSCGRVLPKAKTMERRRPALPRSGRLRQSRHF